LDVNVRILATSSNPFGPMKSVAPFPLVSNIPGDVSVNFTGGCAFSNSFCLSMFEALADFIVERQIGAVFIEASVPRRTIEAVQAAVHAKGFEVEIGGQRIDKHYGDWLHIYNELTQDDEKEEGYDEMIGNVARLRGGVVASAGATAYTVPAIVMHVPLQFWFNRNPGLALPLIALQYHEVKFNFELRASSELTRAYGATAATGVTVPSIASASVYVDYMYLDTDERRRFAQVSHEYLIEQLQFTGDESISNTSNKIRTSFNHPTKELVWVVQKDSHVEKPSADNNFVGNQWSNYQLAAFDVIDIIK